MATHDADLLDRALASFAAVKHDFEAEHGPLPAPAAGLEQTSDTDDAE
jgi:hypothetical protein